MHISTIPVEKDHILTTNQQTHSSRCSQCMQHKYCLSNGLSEYEMHAFNAIAKISRKVLRGEYLYQPGDKLETIYIVRSGSVKNSIIDAEGREQVLNFSLRGDIIGLDSLFLNTHTTESVALETTFLCGIRITDYLNLASRMPKLYHKLLDHMSQRISEEERHSLMLGTKSADQRLAHFLRDLVQRNIEKGLSGHELVLHMSRRDIGSYLSAAVETVSRLFTRLQEQGIIEVHGKRIQIHNMEALDAISSS